MGTSSREVRALAAERWKVQRRKDLKEALGFEIQVTADGRKAYVFDNEESRNMREATLEEIAMWTLLVNPESEWG